MPLANYCKKCKAEVATGESCLYCGAKLAQSGERVSFGVTRLPVRDWFAWNNWLRVALPALALTLAVILVAEGIATGAAGVQALIGQGLMWTMLCALGVTLALILLALALQGRESVHYIMDKDGVRALSYLVSPKNYQLYARFTSPALVAAMQREEYALEGYTLVKNVFLPWLEVRRVRLWPENLTILFFRPSCWQALSVRCTVQDYPLAESFVRGKLKRYKRVKVLPLPSKQAPSASKKEANV